MAPFDSLGVTLGSTAAEVRRARPAAKHVSYGMYVEEQTRGPIVFMFGDAGEGMVSDDDRTTSIAITRLFAKDSTAAFATLASETNRIVASLGERPRCGRITLPLSTGDVRRWQSGSDELQVGVWTDTDTFRLVHVLKRDAAPQAFLEHRDCDTADRFR